MDVLYLDRFPQSTAHHGCVGDKSRQQRGHGEGAMIQSKIVTSQSIRGESGIGADNLGAAADLLKKEPSKYYS